MDPADLFAMVADEFGGFQSQAVAFLPRLAAAFLLLAVGLATAAVIRLLVRRTVSVLDRILPNLHVRSSLRRVGLERPAGEVLATILFWLVLLIFVSSAFDHLGLPVLSTWVQGVVHYLPRVLSALLIGLAGVVAGVFLRDAVTAAAATAGLAYAPVIGRLLMLIVIVISSLIAIDQIGLNVALVANFLIALLAAAFLGAALAFGLGARSIVANILSCHYLRKSLSVGNRVRIGGQDGEIDQITATSVILATGTGRVVIPARLFVEEVTHLVG